MIDKIELSNHMRNFGLHMIGKGLHNATFSEMMNPFSHDMSIVHIAHGTEIVFKARIAQEHPLLIFSKIPKYSKIQKESIDIIDLLEHGQTVMYSEIPDLLWSSAGYKLENLDLYYEFGKIRNQIIHLFAPKIELAELAYNYTFNVVEKAINSWWDETIFEYAGEYDDDFLSYAFEQLDNYNIKTNYALDENYHLVKIE